MRFMLDDDAILPTRAHEMDAGLDFYTREDAYIPAHGYYIFDTGVHVEIPEGYVGFLKSKSGLNVNHNLISDGVIDAGYTGSIVKLYNLGDLPYSFKKGDKITQLVVLPCSLEEIELTDTFTNSDRGSHGFGSSGK